MIFTFCLVVVASLLQALPSNWGEQQYNSSIEHPVVYATPTPVTTEQENETDGQSQNWHNWFWPPEWSTWALVGVAIWAAKIARDTLDDIKKQTSAAITSADAAKKSADASLASAQASLNSERAWIMAELDWVPGMAVLYDVDSVEAHQRNRYISGSFRLTCRNEGKTPGWVTLVRSRLQVVSTLPDPPQVDDWGYVDPIERAFSAKAEPSHWDMGLSYAFPPNESYDSELSMRIVWGIVEYRDIFDKTRKTFFGYSVGPDNKTLTRLISRTYSRNE